MIDLKYEKTHDKLDIRGIDRMVVRPFVGAKGGQDDRFKQGKGCY